MISRLEHWLKILEAPPDTWKDNAGRCVIFKADRGQAISFMINVAPTPNNGGKKYYTRSGKAGEYARLVVACGGRLELPTSAARINLNRVAIMVDPDLGPPQVQFNGAYTFKMRYILDCVEEGMLLNLGKYVASKPMLNHPADNSSIDSESMFFFDVFYWRTAELPQPTVVKVHDSNVNKGAEEDEVVTSSERSVSESAHNSRDTESEAEVSTVDWISCSDRASVARRDDSSEDDIGEDMRSLSKITSRSVVNKNSRAMYTRLEKEAILKFIVARKAFAAIKGNKIYIDMETHNICPCRTYQSMRNHFLKTIVNELDTFKFLTDKQKTSIKNCL